MYINHSHAGTMFRHMFIFREQFLHHLFRHAKAIIPHLYTDVVPISVADHMDLSLVIHALNSIVNGIFQKGLHDQLHGAAILNLFCDLKIHLEPVLVTDFLNIHIVLCMLDLIFYPNNRLAFA